ncbi:hypothetical protein GEMRC1_012311 [Eukaryota sp. GEM-RC1]
MNETPQRRDDSSVFLELDQLQSPPRSGSVETILADMNKGIPSTAFRHRNSPLSNMPKSISPPSYSPYTSHQSSSSQRSSSTPSSPNTDIISRLERIESLVLNLTQTISPHFPSTTHSVCHSSSNPISSQVPSNRVVPQSSNIDETEERLQTLSERTFALKKKLSNLQHRPPSTYDKLAELEERISRIESLLQS